MAGIVLAALKSSGAKRVVDLGCGEGRLLQLLLQDATFQSIAGMDVSHWALARAEDRLHLDRLAPRQRERLTLIQGSLTYDHPGDFGAVIKRSLRPGRVLRACYPLAEAERAFRAAREVPGKTWIRF